MLIVTQNYHARLSYVLGKEHPSSSSLPEPTNEELLHLWSVRAAKGECTVDDLRVILLRLILATIELPPLLVYLNHENLTGITSSIFYKLPASRRQEFIDAALVFTDQPPSPYLLSVLLKSHTADAFPTEAGVLNAIAKHGPNCRDGSFFAGLINDLPEQLWTPSVSSALLRHVSRWAGTSEIARRFLSVFPRPDDPTLSYSTMRVCQSLFRM